jgi:hypothetical protein
MKRLITICAVVGLITAVTGTVQAALDIDAIYIDSCKDYTDGTPDGNPWDFEISVDFVDTGSLHHIDVSKPGDSTPSITIIYKDNWWGHESPTDYLTLADLQKDYPSGEYTLDFRNSNNELLCSSVTLDYSGIAEPCNPVNFIYPSTDGQTGISTTPTFTWTVNAGNGNALGMWVWDPNADDDVYGNVPVPMTTTSWAPGPLLPNHHYGIDVSVCNVKNPQPGPALPTTMVDNDTFSYGLVMEYCNTIEFTTVPEPATICLLGLGALSLLRRKR